MAAKTKSQLDLFGKRRVMRLTPHKEEDEQIAFMAWLQIAHPKLGDVAWHTPNGGKRGPREALRFKAMGVKPGIPDVLVMYPQGPYRGLAIEMKRTGATWCAVSKEQREWLERFDSVGWLAVPAYGLDHAMKIVEEYLKLTNY
jgi:hypothetical protein